MPKFSDMLSSVGMAEDGISPLYPETFLTDIQSAYDEDMSLPASRISVLEADLAAAQTEIVALKAHNYELLMSRPAESPDSADDDAEADEDSDSADTNDDDEGVSGLFKKKDSE